MKRILKKIQLDNPDDFKLKLFEWSKKHKQIAWFDSNHYEQKYSSYDIILAVDAHTFLKKNHHNAFAEFQRYKNQANDYIFGYLGYDLKNNVELLSSNNIDGLDFDDLYFFQPKKIFFVRGHELEIQYLKGLENEIDNDLKNIQNISINAVLGNAMNEVKIRKRITKKQYLKKLNTILNHIQRGDIYEVNFCQEFYANNASINPFEVYKKLNEVLL